MKKIFDVFLFVLLVSTLVFAGLACIGEVQVQAASKKPSVPEFTIKFVDNSYDVASVQEVDPFTGKTYVAMPDYRAVIHNIEITIKNQPGYSDLWYNVRYKGQFGSEDTWIELYDISSGFPSQSESKYTVLNFTSTRGPEFYDALHARIAVTDGGTADFQVQAINGVTGEKSGWSNTKDLTVDIYSSKTNNQFDLDSSAPVSLDQTETQAKPTLAGLNLTAFSLVIACVVIVALIFVLVYKYSK